MITLENQFFPLRSAVCFFVEGGIILVSVVASAATSTIGFHDAILRGVVVAFICQSCMYLLDMYDLKNSQTWGELFFSLIFAVGVVCVGIGLVTYAVPDFGVGGKMYYRTILFVSIFLLIWRVLFDIYLTRFAPKESVLVMGSGEPARLMGEEILKRERMGFHLVGFVEDPEARVPQGAGTAPIIGNYSQVVELISANRVRRLVVAITERRGGYPVDSLLDLRVRGCKVTEWASFYEKLSGRIPIDNLAPSYFIFQEGFSKSRALLDSRRIVSMSFAVGLLLLLFPLLIITAILIKIDSPGPVFYTQKRVGEKGKVFDIIKFRSMRVGAEQNGRPQWAVRDDPRVTRIGKFIRATRLDELPQLINVLCGDLDIVGPRPERPEFVEELNKRLPYYTLRHTVKPGLTGWAQVMFYYSGTIEESKKKLQYDLFYIKNMSIKLDFLILFRTIKIVLLGRGAL